MPELEIPNLEACSDDELREFAGKLYPYSRLNLLVGMMENARYLRRAGSIRLAQKEEEGIEEIYRSLPEAFRW